MRKKTWKKCLAVILSVTMLPWSLGEMPVSAAESEGLPTPAYKWDFEAVEGTEVVNGGSVLNGEANLKGTAKVEASKITVDGQECLGDSNQVLTLSGGSKGSSYVELPSDLYSGVSADTGLTWSFWMKEDSDIVSYSRAFSSSNSGNGMEFAYAPYASDKVWNLIFDDGDSYRHIYGSEPEKSVWNYITLTVSGEEVVFYINGDKVSSSCTKGDGSILKNRLNGLSAFTNHALGKTTSTWSDADCKVQLDDVSIYKEALTEEEVAELARGYGLKVQGPRIMQDATEGIYAGESLEQIQEFTTTSEDGKLVVKFWKDAKDAYYYSVSREGKVVLECSALGLVTAKEDLSNGLKLQASSLMQTTGRENYDILQGSTSHVDKVYHETSFVLTKGNSEVKVIFRVFDDGMAYRYEVDGDTSKTTETTYVQKEASEFVLPDKGTIWTVPVSQTYEGIEYTKRTIQEMYETESNYSTPILASLQEDSGNTWVLLAEANVYNEEEPYCASIFKTVNDDKSMQVTFGRYLNQETDESKDKSTYSASYSYITEVEMQNEFHTPWRVAIIGEDLESVTNSSLIMDLNPEPEGDFSWVEPGASVWSWWSTSYDAIQYTTMIDYIDFAAETGMKYCLVDYGWELWDDYKSKIASLVEYADEKGVSLLLWYGVNKFDGKHIFDLDSADAIEEEFAWCEEVGVKGVKVDYINSDSQFAMEIMYNLADIAAEHHLILNYHGCTDPNGENRTYPNILSSEAVAGMENYKWNNGSSTATLLTIPYTRNVLGSMEFTPTAYRVHSSNATAGFMLATSIVYESAIQSFAHSAYVYEGYNGLSLIADVPAVWDESRLLGGYPGENIIRARRSKEDWYLAAMTLEAETYQVPLDFLDKGCTYNAYIYTDNKAGDNIEFSTQKVTAETVLDLKLLANGGCGIKLSKTDSLKKTAYDNFNYYEAEDTTYAVLSGAAVVAEDQYASGLKCVGYVGGSADNTLTFEKIQAKVAGEYDLRVYYVCGTARDLYIKVNDEEPVCLLGLVGNANDWKAVAAKTITVSLQKGENSICLYNNSGYTPDIDRIAVEKTDISSAMVTLSTDTYTYTGAECKPEVTVVFAGETLVQDKDYTIAYHNNINAGTAQVTISGTGNCYGRITKTFVIKAPAIQENEDKTENKTEESKDTTPVKVKKPAKVTLSKVKSPKAIQITVTWKKLSKKEKITGYQISYGTKKNGKNAKIKTVKASKKSITIKKLKSRKKYYIRVRAYKMSGKTKVYGNWSKVKFVKVK